MAARDIPVFPCSPGSKSPLAGSQGFKDATTDRDQINAWWADQDCNVAFCPADAGLAVVDVEREGLANWDLLEASYGETATRTVYTPGGGIHLHFFGSLPPTHSRIAEKIDTRGVGSYVLLPPSIVDGKPYTWRDEQEDPAPLPAWVEPLTRSVHEHKAAEGPVELDLPHNVKLAREIVARTPTPEPGERNEAVYRLACRLCDQGVSEQLTKELLEAWDAASAEDHALAIWSAYRNRQNDPGCASEKPAETEFAQGKEALTPPLRFRLRSVEEILARPPRDWLIPDMIAERSIGLIYGKYDTFKTFLTVALLMPIALERRVVYIAGEDEDGVAEKVAAWCKRHDVTDHKLMIVDEMPQVARPQDIVDFVNDMVTQRFRPDALAIDTASRALVGMDENAAKDMSVFIRNMDELKRKLGAAIIGVHHANAQGELRGSTAIPGGVDFLAKVECDYDAKAVKLRMEKQKKGARRREPWFFLGTPEDKSLVFEEIDEGVYTSLTSGTEAADIKQAVGQALKDMGARGDGGVSTHVLAEHMVQGEDPEAGPAAVSLMERRLGQKANNLLTAYNLGQGANRKWALPE